MNDDNNRLTPLSADLHIHSALSPCAEDEMTPDNIVNRLAELDVDIFSITDHNAGFNSKAFEAAACKRNLLFIPGIELQSSEEVHLLGYFADVNMLENFCTDVVRPHLTQGVKNDPERFGRQIKIQVSGALAGEVEAMLSMPLTLTVNELADRINEYGGVPVAAHIDRGFSLIAQLGFIPPDLAISAVEIWDAGKIESVRREHLKGMDLRVLSSSDTHYLHMMKPAKMKFWVKEQNVLACLDCMKGKGAGRITIKEGKSKNKGQANVQEGSGKDWKSIYGHT